MDYQRVSAEEKEGKKKLFFDHKSFFSALNAVKFLPFFIKSK
jgi:hypothetical protein